MTLPQFIFFVLRLALLFSLLAIPFVGWIILIAIVWADEKNGTNVSGLNTNTKGTK